jgi:hypothetical protein
MSASEPENTPTGEPAVAPVVEPGANVTTPKKREWPWYEFYKHVHLRPDWALETPRGLVDALVVMRAVQWGMFLFSSILTVPTVYNCD